MRGLVLGPPDLRHPSVRSHDDQRSQFRLESSIQEGEALDIEHVNLVNEQYLWTKQ